MSINSTQRTMVYIFASTFIVTLGFGAYVYLIPVFAMTLHASYVDLGLIGTAAAIPYAIVPIFSGHLSDRFNRIHVFLLGIVYNALATVILIIASDAKQLIILRLIGGIGLALFWPIAEALISSLTPSEHLVKVMGRFSATWALGYLIGPFLGGYISQNFGYYSLFLLTSIIIASAIVPLAKVLPHYRSNFNLGRKGFDVSIIKNALPAYLLVLPHALIFNVLLSIFPGYASSLKITDLEIGILFTLFGLARIVFFLLSGSLIKYGFKPLMMTASLILFLSSIMLTLFQTTLTFILPLVMMGIAIGILSPALMSVVIRMVPREQVGLAIGVYESFFGIGFIIGPILAGIIAEVWLPNTPYILIGSSALFMIPCIIKLRIDDRSRLSINTGIL
ncbi:MAG: MFS transporter [Nitrososphaerota archaeon]|nr:MFS transporter [Nitrososphaerales archaeon]MDW8044391.1 MFS transporter [Nitrososphaerota archaeon]